jgi:hypothetical protein
MRPDGFELPAELRRIRAWWLREARRHLDLARTGDRAWNLRMAADARRYARGVVAKWLEKP